MRAILIIFLSALVHGSACAGSGFGKTDSSRFNIEVQLGNQFYKSHLAASVNNSRIYEYFTITARNASDYFIGKTFGQMGVERNFDQLLAPNISIKGAMKIGKPGNVRNPELLLDLTFFEVAYLSSHIQSPYGSQAINTTGRHYHSLAVYFRRELVKINDLFSQKNRKLLLYGGLMFGRVNDFYGGAYEISRHVLNYYNNPNITGDTIFITRYSVDLNQYTVLMVGGLDWKLPLTRGAVGRCAMISLQYNLGLRTLYGQTVNVQRNNDPNILQCELGTNGSGFVFKIGIELFKRRLE